VLRLRRVREEDEALLLRWANLPEIAKHSYHADHVITEDEHRVWFTAMLSDPTKRYWIVQADGYDIGTANLYNIGLRSAYWSFDIVEGHGGGAGSRVECAIINYVFDDLGLPTLYCEVLASNQKVIEMHRRFGFRVLGPIEERPAPAVLMMLQCPEWDAAKSSPVLARLAAAKVDVEAFDDSAQ
jgi:UDP-4-amino-4,6-dideoxy-N-acetyl-beta-L-altrosamine N-acetyltransferase